MCLTKFVIRGTYMALLEYDKELMKKLELDFDLSKEKRLEFIDAQIGGVQTQLWRSRVDAMLNHGLATKSKDEELAVQAKINEHEKDIEKFVQALKLMRQLRDEVEAE